jgi:hypothetical protein
LASTDAGLGGSTASTAGVSQVWLGPLSVAAVSGTSVSLTGRTLCCASGWAWQTSVAGAGSERSPWWQQQALWQQPPLLDGCSASAADSSLRGKDSTRNARPPLTRSPSSYPRSVFSKIPSAHLTDDWGPTLRESSMVKSVIRSIAPGIRARPKTAASRLTQPPAQSDATVQTPVGTRRAGTAAGRPKQDLRLEGVGVGRSGQGPQGRPMTVGSGVDGGLPPGMSAE